MLTPNQKRLIAIRPHFAEIFSGKPSSTVPISEVIPLAQAKPPCIHRGKLLDKTTCGCPVWLCSIHGTCSTSRRSGLKLCQECGDYVQVEKT